ncbi:hypothetical protein FQN60_009325, partial [Etheostoma spectabile]
GAYDGHYNNRGHLKLSRLCAGQGRSRLVACCQRGYRWRSINDREKSRRCDKILREKALYCKSLKMDHVMEVVVQTVNFIRVRGLRDHQFDCLLNDNKITHGLPYHTEHARVQVEGERHRGDTAVWETQLACGDPAHFPGLRDVSATVVNAGMKRYKDKIPGLLWEFEKQFQVFVKASDVPVDIQLEIIDLPCDTNLKNTFASVDLDTFYQYLLPGYPRLTALAAKVLCMFGTTYLCEQSLPGVTVRRRMQDGSAVKILDLFQQNSTQRGSGQSDLDHCCHLMSDGLSEREISMAKGKHAASD